MALPHRGHWQYLEIFLVVTTCGDGEEDAGLYWVEAGDAAKHAKMHRRAPVTQNYLATNVHSAKFEKTLTQIKILPPSFRIDGDLQSFRSFRSNQ